MEIVGNVRKVQQGVCKSISYFSSCHNAEASVAFQAEAAPSNLFKVLRTTWTLSPSPSNAPHPSKSLPHSAPSLSTPGDPAQNSQEKQEDPTLVSIDLAYEFANPLYAAAASSAFQRVSGKIMGAFEKRVREVYGDGLQ